MNEPKAGKTRRSETNQPRNRMNATPDDELTLAATRDDLRRALGSRRTVSGTSRLRDDARRSPEFPRSRLMRALLSEELRWVWVAGATALTVAAGRRLTTAQQLGRWIGAYSLARRLFDRMRL
jgi:hypothetical protein